MSLTPAASLARRSSLTAAIAAALLAGVACDPSDGEDAEELALQQDADAFAVAGPVGPFADDSPEAHLTAPLTATVELPGDVLVEYYDQFDGTVAVYVEGPAHVNLDEAMMQVQASVADATRGAEAGRTLEQIRDGILDVPLRAAPATAAQHAPDGLANNPRAPSFVANNGITASGQGTLHANVGNTSLFSRDSGETTSWQWDDVIAYGGHVSSQNGDFHWNVKKQNWGVGSWYFAMTQDRLVANGQQAYFVTSNKENDFNLVSTVEALDDNSNHHHDVGFCHDWNSRTGIGSSLAGGCRITAGIVSPSVDFCTELGYFGVDPSNIPTSAAWDGNGTPTSCP